MKNEIMEIFGTAKNIPEELWENNKGFDYIDTKIDQFKLRYKKDNRSIKLSEKEKLALIEKQGNISPISGKPIYLGDDIEVDHLEPISRGGKDDPSNLQIVHKDENRSKGSKKVSSQKLRGMS